MEESTLFDTLWFLGQVAKRNNIHAGDKQLVATITGAMTAERKMLEKSLPAVETLLGDAKKTQRLVGLLRRLGWTKGLTKIGTDFVDVDSKDIYQRALRDANKFERLCNTADRKEDAKSSFAEAGFMASKDRIFRVFRKVDEESVQKALHEFPEMKLPYTPFHLLMGALAAHWTLQGGSYPNSGNLQFQFFSIATRDFLFDDWTLRNSNFNSVAADLLALDKMNEEVPDAGTHRYLQTLIYSHLVCTAKSGVAEQIYPDARKCVAAYIDKWHQDHPDAEFTKTRSGLHKWPSAVQIAWTAEKQAAEKLIAEQKAKEEAVRLEQEAKAAEEIRIAQEAEQRRQERKKAWDWTEKLQLEREEQLASDIKKEEEKKTSRHKVCFAGSSI